MFILSSWMLLRQKEIPFRTRLDQVHIDGIVNFEPSLKRNAIGFLVFNKYWQYVEMNSITKRQKFSNLPELGGFEMLL